MRVMSLVNAREASGLTKMRTIEYAYIMWPGKPRGNCVTYFESQTMRAYLAVPQANRYYLLVQPCATDLS